MSGQEHTLTREENGRLVRVVCTCGHKGRWRARSAFLVEKQLRSDESGHLHAIQREKTS